MREYCTCNSCAAPNVPYKTPWCDMLMRSKSSCGLLHLWYNLEMVRKEIEKRTAYLGKFRRTEEAKHLLDLIQMTEDNENMFVPFAKAAMSDVFDVLSNHMPTHEKALWWMEGKDTVIIDDDESESGDESEDEPIVFHAGQYVLYNGELYIAIADGDSRDIAGKLVPTEDYRNSMHYGIMWNCCSNINAVEPLDVAIFEALVARIIYKWLQYAYPDEAPRYLAEFDEYKAQIKSRANILDGPKIINRIPRIY